MTPPAGRRVCRDTALPGQKCSWPYSDCAHREAIARAAVEARDRQLRAAVEAERREPPWPQFGVPSGHEATARDAYNAALDAVLRLLDPADARLARGAAPGVYGG